MWLLQGGIDPIAFPMLYEAMLDEIDEQNPRSDSVTKAVMTRLQSEFLLQNSEPALASIRQALPDAPYWVSAQERKRLLAKSTWAQSHWSFLTREIEEAIEFCLADPRRAAMRGGAIISRVTFKLGSGIAVLLIADKLDAVIRTLKFVQKSHLFSPIRKFLKDSHLFSAAPRALHNLWRWLLRELHMK